MMSAQSLNYRIKCLATLPLLTLLALQTGCANNAKTSSTLKKIKTISTPEARQLTGKYPTATGTTDYIPKSTDQPTTPKTTTSATSAILSAPNKMTRKPVTTPTNTSLAKKTTVENAKPMENAKPIRKTQTVVSHSPVKPAPVVEKAHAVKSTKVDTVTATPTAPAPNPTAPNIVKKVPSEEVQLALAEPVPQNPDLPPALAAMTAADLPYNFGVWTLERNWDNQHPDTCRLISNKIPLSDGYEETTLRAEVLLDAINIHTGSNIDLSYENSGIQLGDAELVPYSKLMGEISATVEGGFTDELALGGEMTVNIGFWPTWPKTETQQVVIPLSDMDKALAAMFACNHL